jgi:hypothetical protein
MFNFLKAAAPAYHNLTLAQFGPAVRKPGAVLLTCAGPTNLPRAACPAR